MQKIYSHEDRFMVQQVKQLLEDNGIPCFIKNEFAGGAIGELAPFDTWPEVWLTDSEWQTRAEHLINTLQSQPQRTEPWVCQHCHEKNEGSFEVCWQCGAERPD